MQNLRNRLLVALAAAAMLCFAIVTYSYAKPQIGAATAGQQPGDAYQNGYQRGLADAQTNVSPNNQASSDQWVTEDTRRAYREGYNAGYGSVAPDSTPSAAVPLPGTAPAMASNTAVRVDATRYGYDDGLAAGRKDRDSGHSFRPTDSESYKHGDHGWTGDLGPKDHYRQQYREAYAQGYQDGYGSAGNP